METNLVDTKQNVLALINTLLNQNVLSSQDLRRYVNPVEDMYDPAFVQHDWEQWYLNLGIESIIKRKFVLQPCPFTHEEIEEAHRNQELIICVPEGVDRETLGKLFRLDTWALYDPLVTAGTEKADFWFRTSMSLQPSYTNATGLQLRHQFEQEGKVHFSLERYLVFIARMRYLTHQTPDKQFWIWLLHRPFDRSGLLMAGFDSHGSLSVHGWMPQFSASFLGARYGIPPKKV